MKKTEGRNSRETVLLRMSLVMQSKSGAMRSYFFQLVKGLGTGGEGVTGLHVLRPLQDRQLPFILTLSAITLCSLPGCFGSSL
jgi:hypothetical protein